MMVWWGVVVGGVVSISCGNYFLKVIDCGGERVDGANKSIELGDHDRKVIEGGL